MTRLRLVVITAGPLTPVNRVFFERLARDPLVDLTGVIVDEYRRPPKPLLTRVAKALREDGAGWLAFKIGSKLRSVAERLIVGLADWAHGRPVTAESYETLEARTGVRIHRVADIHDAHSVALIRSLSPELAIIVGGRILRESVISIPTHGTLNIHKRKVPDYRGGGPVGYWEVLAGEPSIGVTIHYAATDVDAGPVLAEKTIPIESCDTLDSLRLKADLEGVELYHDTIRQFAQGRREGTPQDRSRGTTYRAPSEYKVSLLQRRLERRAAAAMKRVRPSLSWIVRLRVLAQYIAVLPRLLAVRRRLIREHRAPISIFFYHLVADRPLNHMCLSLSTFVRQVEFLRRHYSIVSLDDAVETLRSGRNDRIAASITFDDGYRDNTWAIKYLRYFGIPATFFVSIGHVQDGSAFEHDRQRGFEEALPMSEADIRSLAENGFGIGSHGVHHEDFGALTPETADRLLRESGELIANVYGQAPEHFSFPKGQRGKNINEACFDLALKHYPYIFSAYGGYCYPRAGRRHFLRTGNPTNVLDLAIVMSGYTGFRDCLNGNPWGIETETLDPCSAVTARAVGVRA